MVLLSISDTLEPIHDHVNAASYLSIGVFTLLTEMALRMEITPDS